ncbi:unnamed protein product [Discula destructiva]
MPLLQTAKEDESPRPENRTRLWHRPFLNFQIPRQVPDRVHFPMTSLADELAYQASTVRPLVPQGRSLAFVIVTALCLISSWVLVGLRTWCRAIWLSNVWGLDDTLAVLGLVAYTVTSVYAFLGAAYGIGTPDSELDPLLPYAFRGRQYNTYWEVSYLFASALVKTSVGVAVIRIALERRYRYTIYAFIFASNATCIGGVIWEFAACRPVSTRWNLYEGSCNIPGFLVLTYGVTAVTVVTDAGYALVPIFILRRLSMRPRIKYGLMFVLALGSVAAIASVVRYPFIVYFNVEEEYLYNNVWIPMLSQVELAIGLTSGSLPGIAKMFHFLDPPTKPLSQRGEEGWAAHYSIGGSPLDDLQLGTSSRHGSSGASRIGSTSENSSSRRTSIPKLTISSVKGMWQVKTVT